MKLNSLLQLDALTQLPNRAGWMQATQLAFAHDQQASDEASPSKTRHSKAMLFVDLDRFKWVNDTLGHEAGDELLCEVATRLLNEVDLNASPPDMVGRLGGDEFVVLLQAPDSMLKVEQIAQRMIDSLSESFELQAGEADIGGSIGISSYPQDGREVEALLSLADLAMYRAKHSGRNQWVRYNSEMTRQIKRRQMLQGKIRDAVRNDGFELRFCPVYDAQAEHIVALHAVVHCQDPELNELEVEAFYSISDESQLGVRLGQWIIQASLDSLENMSAVGVDLPLIVDMRPGLFQQRDLVDWLEEQIETRDVSAEQLLLAMNERCLNTQRFAVHEQLKLISKLGCELAIQDFATGQWSISQLHDWPISQLHLSPVFVQGMLQNHSTEALAEAVLSLGHTLNKKVVAYGVHSDEHQAFLKTYRCAWIQGEWLGAVLDLDEVINQVAYNRQRSDSDTADPYFLDDEY